MVHAFLFGAALTLLSPSPHVGGEQAAVLSAHTVEAQFDGGASGRAVSWFVATTRWTRSASHLQYVRPGGFRAADSVHGGVCLPASVVTLAVQASLLHAIPEIAAAKLGLDGHHSSNLPPPLI